MTKLLIYIIIGIFSLLINYKLLSYFKDKKFLYRLPTIGLVLFSAFIYGNFWGGGVFYIYIFSDNYPYANEIQNFSLVLLCIVTIMFIFKGNMDIK